MLITHDDSEKYLEMLKKHFPQTTTFEKHPKAMMNIMFDRACDKILGKNYAKKRISMRKQVKLYNYLLQNLRNCYGRWINLTDFKAKDPNNIKFVCNLSYAFKNEYGVIYASPNSMLGSDVLYTRHCFERFEERFDLSSSSLPPILAERIKGIPTAADVLFILTEISTFEYAIKKNFYFLNLQVGALVLEDFKDFFLAKTFLTQDMLDEDLRWMTPTMSEEEARVPWAHFNSLRELLSKDPISIEVPVFRTKEESK